MITKIEYKILSVFDDGNNHTIEQIRKTTNLSYKEALHLTNILITHGLLNPHIFKGYMRSEKGTLAKFEYKEVFKDNLFNKLLYPITQNIASHILVLLTGFIIGLISSGKLYKLIQIIFHI